MEYGVSKNISRECSYDLPSRRQKSLAVVNDYREVRFPRQQLKFYKGMEQGVRDDEMGNKVTNYYSTPPQRSDLSSQVTSPKATR